MYQKLGGLRQEIGQTVGIHEGYLSARATGKPGTGEEAQRHLFVCSRFFTALALCDLLRETPVRTVAERYRSNRGSLQQLMQKGASLSLLDEECSHSVATRPA